MEALRAALSPSVKVLALSHIMFTTGLRIPAEEIVAAAHEAGALVLLDAAQTAGHVALDLTAMDVDFYASSGQKWLLGPTGSGALYVRPDRRELLAPLFTRPGLNQRQGLGMYALASQGVAERAGYAEAVRINRELGPEKVEEHTNRLAAMLRAELSEIEGVRLNGPTDPSDGVRHHSDQRRGLGCAAVRRGALAEAPGGRAACGVPRRRAPLHRILQRRNRRRARRRSDSSRSQGVGGTGSSYLEGKTERRLTPARWHCCPPRAHSSGPPVAECGERFVGGDDSSSGSPPPVPPSISRGTR